MASKKPEEDLAERLRQFEVVCKVAIQCRRAGFNVKRHNKVSLETLGAERFGLNKVHTRYCVARAKNYLLDIRTCERERNAKALKRNPIQSS